MTTPPAPLPGWYPDPFGAQGQRYWDGQQWTQVPPPPPQQPVVINNVVGSNMVAPATVFVRTGPNHALHLILTLLTCGMWAPVWLIVTIADAATAHSTPGRPASPSDAKPILAVCAGAVLLLATVAHPWLLAVVIPVCLGGVCYWYYRRRQTSQAAISARADTQNQAYMSGDPSGFFGQYPPELFNCNYPPPGQQLPGPSNDRQ